MLCQNFLQKFQLSTSLMRKIKILPAYSVLFSTSQHLKAKLFLENENIFAHHVLENSLKPYHLFRPKINSNSAVDSLSDGITNPYLPIEAIHHMDEVYNDFRDLIIFCNKTQTCISDERFEDFVKLFGQTCQKLSDDQLLDCLAYFALLPETKSINTKNFLQLWNALDVECCARIDVWNTDKLLMVCDAWYAMKLAKVSTFVFHSLKRMGRRIKNMTAEQLVQSMFFCNIVRKPLLDMYDYEEGFNKVISSMSLKEISIMSMGFFKTQTPIRNPALIDKIYERLIAEIDTVADITLASILKILRYSSKFKQSDLMIQLLEKLCPHIDKISLICCLHIGLLGIDIQNTFDPVLELIVQRFNNELEFARLKDMERICLVVSLFNYNSPSDSDKKLCANILEKLKTKVDEVVLHPRCFPNCLHYLSMKGFYDEELISLALSKKFIRHTYSKKPLLARELFCLDSFTKINLKDSYMGNRLEDKTRRTMGKLMTDYVPDRNSKFRLSLTDKILLEVKETTELILKTATFKHILPHFQRPDIVVCYDRITKKSVPLSENCPEDYTGMSLIFTKHF